MKESFHFNLYNKCLYGVSSFILFSKQEFDQCEDKRCPKVIVCRTRLIRTNWLQRSNYFQRQIQISCFPKIRQITGFISSQIIPYHFYLHLQKKNPLSKIKFQKRYFIQKKESFPKKIFPYFSHDFSFFYMISSFVSKGFYKKNQFFFVQVYIFSFIHIQMISD